MLAPKLLAATNPNALYEKRWKALMLGCSFDFIYDGLRREIEGKNTCRNGGGKNSKILSAKENKRILSAGK